MLPTCVEADTDTRRLTTCYIIIADYCSLQLREPSPAVLVSSLSARPESSNPLRCAARRCCRANLHAPQSASNAHHTQPAPTSTRAPPRQFSSTFPVHSCPPRSQRPYRSKNQSQGSLSYSRAAPRQSRSPQFTQPTLRPALYPLPDRPGQVWHSTLLLA